MTQNMVRPLGGIRIQYVLYILYIYSRCQKEHLYAISKQIKTSLCIFIYVYIFIINNIFCFYSPLCIKKKKKINKYQTDVNL